MAIKIKKAVVVITLKEISTANSRESRNDFGASEAERSRHFTKLVSSLIEKNKTFHAKTTICFILHEGCLFYLGGFLPLDKIEHYFINLCCKVFRSLHNVGDEYNFREG